MLRLALILRSWQSPLAVAASYPAADKGDDGKTKFPERFAENQ